jgi:hypothetical protein
MPILALAAALAATAAPQPGELKTFGDWIVGCDNVRACHATSLMPVDAVGDQERSMMSVRRRGEAGAAPVIHVETQRAGARLFLDGRALAARLVRKDDGYEVIPADAAALLRSLRSGRRLEVQGGSAPSGTVSLAGLSAALLYMDDRQKRVGTVTALAAVGSRPATAVPPPPTLPRVLERRPSSARQPIKIAWAQTARWRRAADCDPEIGGRDNRLEVRPLDARTTLALVLCTGGAYNMTSLVLVAQRPDGSDLRPARFDYSASNGERTGAHVPPDGAYWDEEQGRLASFFKGRGLGDCGAGQRWAWDGAMFRLIHAEAMGECRGSTDYITLWRAQPVSR